MQKLSLLFGIFVFLLTEAIMLKPASALFQGGAEEGTPWPRSDSGSTVIPVCFRQPGTVDSDREGNSYIVNYSGEEWLQKRQLVQDALEDSWQRWTRITFQGWGTCSTNLNGYVYVDLIKNDCGGCGDSIPRGYHSQGVRVWLKMENLDERLLRSVVIHEFGHVLGFHHEMDRPDAKASNGTFICTDGPIEYHHGIYLTLYYDDVSIMNYCAPRNRNSASGGDIEGAQRLYGISQSGRWLQSLPSLSLYGL